MARINWRFRSCESKTDFDKRSGQKYIPWQLQLASDDADTRIFERWHTEREVYCLRFRSKDTFTPAIKSLYYFVDGLFRTVFRIFKFYCNGVKCEIEQRDSYNHNL